MATKATATVESAAIIPVETTAIAPVVRDRFADKEYIDPNARLPKITALRGEMGAEECGYFITEADLNKAGWHNIDEGELIIYSYNSGGKERGLLIKSPRMIVVPRSPLFAFDRSLSRQEERLSIAGVYQKSKYSDREKYGTGQAYEVILLNADNKPLHEGSFGYIPRGANQASFSSHWQKLVEEVTKCHAIANGIPFRAKDIRFQCLCVFEFTAIRELAGTNAKSPACKVGSHVSPTQENWETFFLGRNDEMADYFTDLIVPTTELILPTMAQIEAGEIEASEIDYN